MQLGRTGLGSGELVSWGKVLLLGAEVGRQVLVSEGKHMTVLYRYLSGAPKGDLIFDISIDYLGPWNDASGLTAVVETDADAIVASISIN